MPPGRPKRRVTGMCECSATQSESKPRSSSATTNAVGSIEYSVKKIAAPISISVPPPMLRRWGFTRPLRERAKRPLDPWSDLGHHQLHRAHRRVVRSRADLEREAHMDRMGRADFADEFFGDGLD